MTGLSFNITICYKWIRRTQNYPSHLQVLSKPAFKIVRVFWKPAVSPKILALSRAFSRLDMTETPNQMLEALQLNPLNAQKQWFHQNSPHYCRCHTNPAVNLLLHSSLTHEQDVLLGVMEDVAGEKNRNCLA